MKLLISGICGFVGSTLARALRESSTDLEIAGFDNFARPGSELNRLSLKSLGIAVQHLDARSAADIDSLAPADWLLDAAAMPSVLAGIDGRSSSRQVLEHNLGGTIQLLEHCKAHRAGFTLLSTSRVYSIPPLTALPVRSVGNAFAPDEPLPPGITTRGISEDFSTQPPVSLYGSTKLASEVLALEYGHAFGFPVWVNRCGVMAGAGQFGHPEQGIFSFWINSWLRGAPLKYLGFGGTGHQVRDCLHPRDLVPLLRQQFAISTAPSSTPRIINVAGGIESRLSLAQLSDWCAARFGPREVVADPTPRAFDLPWVVLDASLAAETWQWHPQTPVATVLEEIARHAGQHPHWLELSRP